MNTEVKLKTLQSLYSTLLAEATSYFSEANIVEQVNQEKKEKSLAIGKKLVQQFGLQKPEDVFNWVSEVFNCAKWKCEETEEELIATTQGCSLCTKAKNLDSDKAPCQMYCLNPIQGMIKGIDATYEIEVEKTLWTEEQCKVRVK